MENIKNECNNIIKDILIDIEIGVSKDNQEILMQKRLKIKEELENIDDKIEEEIYNRMNLCNSRGHQFIFQRDPGPYGDCWHICTRCGYEY